MSTMAMKFIWYLFKHVMMTVLVYFIARALLNVIGAESEARRIHGRYVLWWMVSAFAIGGPLGAIFGGADRDSGAMGCSLFWMLGGWLVGTIHGAIVLAIRRSLPPESDDHAPHENGTDLEVPKTRSETVRE